MEEGGDWVPAHDLSGVVAILGCLAPNVRDWICNLFKITLSDGLFWFAALLAKRSGESQGAVDNIMQMYNLKVVLFAPIVL